MPRKRNKKANKCANALIEKRRSKFVIGQLVYAKIAGFCPWPAKVTYVFDRWVDVFFFGVPQR